MPEWIRGRPIRLFADDVHDTLIVTVDGHAVATFPAHVDRARCADRPHARMSARSRAARPKRSRKLRMLPQPVSPSPVGRQPWVDTDADGIPDSVDILLGAKKVVLDAAPYVEHYLRLDYPGGDVPRTEGVCTDVIVRALRNMGLDLQAAVHQDATAHPEAYPGIRKLDSNIDHRRVPNLVRWFARHFERVSADALLPGDVVFLDTFASRPGADHVGIVSDRLGASGKPLIINAWTSGYVASEMDLLRLRSHRVGVPQPPLNGAEVPRSVDSSTKVHNSLACYRATCYPRARRWIGPS